MRFALPNLRRSPMLVGMTMCAISLGGNVGDVPATFAEALRLLEASPMVSHVRRSRWYRTAPMGAQAGDVFWNAAAVYETTAAPLDVLNQLQQIEHSCGRVRTVRWGPRTLDLDLLLFGENVIESPRLTVPHPAMWHRRFVLDPLAELIPDAVHPVFQRTIRELQERLLERPLPVGWAVPTSFSSLPQMVGTAHPTVRDVPADQWPTAAIVFAANDVRLSLPQTVRLPDDKTAAAQLATDVLTAALDEPQAM